MEEKTVKIYLSGPMYMGLEQASTWRAEFASYLDDAELNSVYFDILDPCSRFYENKRFLTENGSWIVKIDKMEIKKADVIIVNATHPGWGTPMEHYIAYELGKFVIAFDEKEYSSIWTIAHSHVIVKDHIEAAKWLIHNIDKIEGAF